ncbi:oxidoreductase [Streptomyces sp. RKND-216]|uniref:oxidoreductase n=1 Tax=Streptomyces sp. RKND-216 TaxID=2562581 RepID=UPI00109D9486|nr:oxidoreductase [Streptomyces sp. RKND-216]THA26900.1 oxidoreductase [Streptomyces sp. RKND-216]
MSQPSNGGEPPGDLTAAEVWVWQAFRNGSSLDLRSGEPELDDPDGEHEWGPERTVRARVLARLLLDDEATSLPGRVASLHLTGAYVTGSLTLSGGEIDKFMELRHCRFEEEVRLTEAHLRTARLLGCRIPRLEAARVKVEGDLHLARCVIPDGIRLTDANIGTDLLLNEARVGSGNRTRAIAADGLSVSQEVQASLLTVDGELGLRGATIGGSLFMYGSVLRNTQGRYALHAPQLTVEQSAHFADPKRENARLIQGSTPPAGTYGPFGAAGARPPRSQHFECTGGVKLDDSRFGGSLVLDNARFALERDQEISLRRLSTPELCFTSPAPERGLIVLSGATVENLVDKVSSWPRDERLWMAGFTYQRLIHRGHFSLQQRLDWLAAATPEYSPGPYEQLAAVYRAGGEDADARAVLLEKQRRRRETLPVAGKLWGLIQDWTVAYGYRPGQAALWMVLLWLAGFGVFSRHEPPPLKLDESPQWNAALYTLDLLLPVISFGQDQAWAPEGGYQWLAAVMILLGWILATTVAAGATRLLRRQ